MAAIDHVYLDSGLTDQFDTATDTLGAAAINGSSGTGVFYVGTPNAAIKIQAESNPGVDDIEVAISDASPGSGVEAGHIRLSLTEVGLAAATPGAPLALGATILGGAGSAVPVWYQWDNSVGDGVYTEISLTLPARVEVAV